MIRRGAFGAVALALLGLAAGCGSTSPRAINVGNSAPAVTASTTPTPTTAAGGAIAIPTAVSPQTATTPILAGTTPPVASSSTVAPRVMPRCAGYAGAVVIVDDKFQTDSYLAMKLNGSGQCAVGIPGYLLAGFSPDLSHVAVVDQGTFGSGHEETYISVSPLKGLHLTRIWTMGDDLNAPPTWSPSGKSLAFGLVANESRSGSFAAKGVAQGLWTIGSDGRNPRRLASGDVGPVAWSANGATLAFIMTDQHGQPELATISSGGGRVTVIASIGGPNGSFNGGIANDGIALSPDGKHVALADGSGIDVYPAAGGKPQAIAVNYANRSYTGVVYSPDGTKLMAAGLIARVPAQSTFSTRLGESATTPAFLPNGAPPPGANYFLETMNADGSQAKQVGTFTSLGQLVGWFRG